VKVGRKEFQIVGLEDEEVCEEWMLEALYIVCFSRPRFSGTDRIGISVGLQDP